MVERNVLSVFFRTLLLLAWGLQPQAGIAANKRY